MHLETRFDNPFLNDQQLIKRLSSVFGNKALARLVTLSQKMSLKRVAKIRNNPDACGVSVAMLNIDASSHGSYIL